MKDNPSPFTFANCAVTVRELPAPPKIEPAQAIKIEPKTAEQKCRQTSKLIKDPKWILVAGLGD